MDDEVDLTPARRTGALRSSADVSFSILPDEVTDSVSKLQQTVRNLRQMRTAQLNLPKTTIAEQVRAGAITILQAPKIELQPGKLPVLTLRDVIEGDEPSSRTRPIAEMVVLQAGDVVVPSGGRALVVRVIENGEVVLGQGLYAFRVDGDRIDPTCLAGFLRVFGASAPSRGQTGTSRSDIRRIEIPRLPVDEQRRLGEAFGNLVLLEKAVNRTSAEAEALIRRGLGELAAGRLL
ncbi:restriction endonuclease subunit S domain-containing protein [Nonomuraea turcica]|uniref:hypothetical protein n=1 Tax=Nonomuraea sp. G32 TaxID=3067274 RepID=UPI00273A88EA|nr:hypothetical protein [Nonomuraea sp. G32]MDP4510672.1 hypothetical protein [Nonomuraea sp. G32]